MRTKLIVEVDGSQHAADANVRHDAARTRWLNSEGYRVLRFWNSDVSENLKGVLEKVYEMLQEPRVHPEALTPPRLASRADPPPLGEGEG